MAARGNHSRRSGGANIVKFILLACVLLVMFAAGSTIFGLGNAAESAPPSAPAGSSEPAGNTVVRPTDPAPVITPPQGGEEDASPSPAGSAAPTPTPTPTPDPNLKPLAEKASDMGRGLDITVPQGSPVGDEYFSDAVFIGDSRTEGLKMYSGLTNTTWWSEIGLTVTKAFSDRFAVVDGQWLTVAEALERADYKKVYIMLGMNELGWVYESKYAEDYGRLIDVIKSSHPDAVIYVQSIIPVSKWRDSNDDVNTMANVVRLQKALVAMCEEKGVNYVNVAEVMEDAEGYLPSEATQDGMHLEPEYCKIWMDYLRTHTVQ